MKFKFSILTRNHKVVNTWEYVTVEAVSLNAAKAKVTKLAYPDGYQNAVENGLDLFHLIIYPYDLNSTALCSKFADKPWGNL